MKDMMIMKWIMLMAAVVGGMLLFSWLWTDVIH